MNKNSFIKLKSCIETNLTTKTERNLTRSYRARRRMEKQTETTFELKEISGVTPLLFVNLVTSPVSKKQIINF